jgi:hypothetical protein
VYGVDANAAQNVCYLGYNKLAGGLFVGAHLMFLPRRSLFVGAQKGVRAYEWLTVFCWFLGSNAVDILTDGMRIYRLSCV